MQYLCDTPDGAWAEFLRHEGITSEDELENVARTLWAVEVPDALQVVSPAIPEDLATGGAQTYPACRAQARALRRGGAENLKVRSAALTPGAANGWRVAAGLRAGHSRDGYVYVIFGARPGWTGWRASAAGRPGPELLGRVRPLTDK